MGNGPSLSGAVGKGAGGPFIQLTSHSMSAPPAQFTDRRVGGNRRSGGALIDRLEHRASLPLAPIPTAPLKLDPLPFAAFPTAP